ncbi:MAG: MetQ/NlpA family ABC transporter substrate-binding protein [Firmicutes bacterium]|nr:MetQ/NlpA family ABC transporter substrate-binding protein [Bacillota bacterium]
MKKTLAVILALVLVLGLTACGGSNSGSSSTAAPAVKEITVAASPTPHAEILAVAAENLPEGYSLKVIEFSDYVQPNMVVESGEVFANYFQHVPYLDDFNAQNGTHIVNICGVHVEPMGIYAGKSSDLANIPDGAQIAVPNDTTNEARALLLLEANGVIKLKEGAGITATKNDIAENPHNVEIVEVEAANVPKVKQDVDFAVINTNYAVESGLNPVKDSLAIEGSASAYVNIVCVKAGNENTDEAKALIQACQSEAVKNFIAEKYDGAVVCIF